MEGGSGWVPDKAHERLCAHGVVVHVAVERPSQQRVLPCQTLVVGLAGGEEIPGAVTCQ